MDLDRLREVLVEVAGPDVAARLGTAGAGPVDLRDQFWQWVEADSPVTESGGCLKKTLHHLSTFWDRRDESNIALFHYADLQEDLSGEKRRLAGVLGSTPSRPIGWIGGGRHLRGHGQSSGGAGSRGADPRFWEDIRQFFNNGTTGQWHDLMDPGEQGRNDSWVAK